ncbi:MAG: site-specific integrase, partial [Methanomassiliicoccales archaeon]|jgi:integrase
MGRYPLLEVAKTYVERRSGFIAKSTEEEMQRKHRYLNRVFVELKKEGRVAHTNPVSIDRDDIAAFVEWTRERNLCGYTVEKLLRLLKQLCAFVGNAVFERMKAEGEELPRRSPKGINSLNEEQVELIMQKAEEIGGWQGEVTRFIVAMYPFTGARPSELRLAHIDDIDAQRWTLFIRSPKGQGKWGRQRTDPILPPAREAVIRFLKARKDRLRELGLEEALPLMPAYHRGAVGFYSVSKFRELKKIVQSKLPPGFPDFSLKTFRASFCQMNIDRDPSLISDVSYAMGHSSTRTTEAFYGRIKQDQALERIQRAWEQASAKKRVFDEKYEVSGYA